jgi:DNA-binding winged helix-turn-helix (wHTH) protein
MQVLVYLAERPNEVAVKEKIIESVWDGTFVTDEVLTNAIFEIRKALGDDAKEPRFIQTVPRRAIDFSRRSKPRASRGEGQRERGSLSPALGSLRSQGGI